MKTLSLIRFARDFSIITCSVLTLSLVHAAAPVTKVFGLPIGGKLSQQLKVCPSSALGSGATAKAMCWVDKPFKDKDGTAIGEVVLPNPDGRPEWAAYASFKAGIGKDGTLKWLNLTDINSSRKSEIANSISQRFGLPLETTLAQSAASSAKWLSQGVGIQQMCSDRLCEVRFTSQAERDAQSLAQDAIYRTNSARPATP
ncbi:MAG: hypothetical protein RSE32_08035 [Comamonas sp.]|uniref:hypothetical protein n=1 Tax=Comamonas sp. TaxID=34028 RepID=UPI002FCAB4FD